jgi:hypothetical protein
MPSISPIREGHDLAAASGAAQLSVFSRPEHLSSIGPEGVPLGPNRASLGEASTASRRPTKMRPPGGKCIATQATDQRRGGHRFLPRERGSTMGTVGESDRLKREGLGLRRLAQGEDLLKCRGAFHVHPGSAHLANCLRCGVMARNSICRSSGVKASGNASVIRANQVNERLVKGRTLKPTQPTGGYSTSRASGAPRLWWSPHCGGKVRFQGNAAGLTANGARARQRR